MKHGHYEEDDRRVWYFKGKKVKNESEWKRLVTQDKDKDQHYD